MKSYKELRSIDVTEHMEKKGKFTYLSWAWAVDQLMMLDENASWSYDEPQVFNDGSVMIYCTVEAFGRKRKMQLPVLDFKNNPIQNPNAFQINTAMQRCLAKAIALHGIGLHIYAGEDLPPEDEAVKEKKAKATNKIQVYDIVNEIHSILDPDLLQGFVDSLDVLESMNDADREMIEGVIESRSQALIDGCKELWDIKFANIDHARQFYAQAQSQLKSVNNKDAYDMFMSRYERHIKALKAHKTANEAFSKLIQPYRDKYEN